MTRRFEGKTAVVTGASRGIGLAIAQRLVADGARVVITARRQEALDAAVAELGGPAVALAVAGSTDDEAHQDETIARAIETFGAVDLLVNNTGINPVYGPLRDLDLAAARKILEVNVLATLSWVKKVAAAWQGEHGGAIVNVASVVGLRPSPGIAFYGVSKAAVIHLTEELAVELGPGIRVNAVAPGVVKTRFSSALYEGREEDVAAPYPLKRLGTPDDVGATVAFLLSEDAAWMTGQTLTVDGGLLLTGGV
ncbi:SDR family oxidoreductase [Microbacterium sp. No. 7]|uniref:SDR family oxidoreductase n=1 Tax=Microbacterium sp. No. 7 TaxID=1714373 RepID=UPI0006CFD921|nr:SDR family oxidoreductase [Microbacterium sp. No. 7]ALJ18761.1 3-ketoacyl-ACP reductase [Microbacterium sp. No. 7]